MAVHGLARIHSHELASSGAVITLREKRTGYMPPKVSRLQPASFSIDKIHEN
jgi:hypothetical protein